MHHEIQGNAGLTGSGIVVVVILVVEFAMMEFWSWFA